jgi:hypothetical protein
VFFLWLGGGGFLAFVALVLDHERPGGCQFQGHLSNRHQPDQKNATPVANQKKEQTLKKTFFIAPTRALRRLARRS